MKFILLKYEKTTNILLVFWCILPFEINANHLKDIEDVPNLIPELPTDFSVDKHSITKKEKDSLRPKIRKLKSFIRKENDKKRIQRYFKKNKRGEVRPDTFKQVSHTSSHDPLQQSDEWHLVDIQADHAWNLIDSSPNVTIGLVDSGVNHEHADLIGNIDIANAYNIPKQTTGAPPYEEFLNESVKYIPDWHGTHLCSIMAGRHAFDPAQVVTAIAINDPQASVPYTVPSGWDGGFRGIADRVNILPVKVTERLASNIALSFDFDDTVDGIEYAAQNSDIVNISVNIVESHYHSNNTQILDVFKQYPETLFVIPSGNKGWDLSVMQLEEISPGQFVQVGGGVIHPDSVLFDWVKLNNVIIVGGSDPSHNAWNEGVDQDGDGFIDSSSYGNDVVDVCAPAMHIPHITDSINLIPSGGVDYYFKDPFVESLYSSGTSVSAPMVAASLALMRERLGYNPVNDPVTGHAITESIPVKALIPKLISSSRLVAGLDDVSNGRLLNVHSAVATSWGYNKSLGWCWFGSFYPWMFMVPTVTSDAPEAATQGGENGWFYVNLEDDAGVHQPSFQAYFSPDHFSVNTGWRLIFSGIGVYYDYDSGSYYLWSNQGAPL